MVRRENWGQGEMQRKSEIWHAEIATVEDQKSEIRNQKRRIRRSEELEDIIRHHQTSSEDQKIRHQIECQV